MSVEKTIREYIKGFTSPFKPTGKPEQNHSLYIALLENPEAFERGLVGAATAREWGLPFPNQSDIDDYLKAYVAIAKNLKAGVGVLENNPTALARAVELLQIIRTVYGSPSKAKQVADLSKKLYKLFPRLNEELEKQIAQQGESYLNYPREKEWQKIKSIPNDGEELYQYCLKNCLKHPKAIHMGLILEIFSNGDGTPAILIDWITKRAQTWHVECNPAFIRDDINFFMARLGKAPTISPELALQLIQALKHTLDYHFLRFYDNNPPKEVSSFLKQLDNNLTSLQEPKDSTVAPDVKAVTATFHRHLFSLCDELNKLISKKGLIDLSYDPKRERTFKSYLEIIGLFGVKPLPEKSSLWLTIDPALASAAKENKESKKEPPKVPAPFATNIEPCAPEAEAEVEIEVEGMPPSTAPSAPKEEGANQPKPCAQPLVAAKVLTKVSIANDWSLQRREGEPPPEHKKSPDHR